LFLSGMANMELKNFDGAIRAFESVLGRNKQSGDELFQDEAEYYLPMSCLANHHETRGITILERIREDKNRLYYKKVNEMSGIDLGILRLKTGRKQTWTKLVDNRGQGLIVIC